MVAIAGEFVYLWGIVVDDEFANKLWMCNDDNRLKRAHPLSEHAGVLFVAYVEQ